ncbi:endonuclease/exonuclease/phosphatase family protein [Larkinella punicea]|uniref:Endonuclease n=1 Tax=Larkinella punicea TaxID=2315727 RepID=A0A368JDJ4_9BACT|nr:endonuclease/exonuclease/phosphatase family protein [Larkinella punicea]RCR65748.1 endonuclease [Larkinella punicea]
MKFSLRLGVLVSSFFSSLLWSLNLLLFLYTLLVYYLLYEVPIGHWTASILMISLPVAWACNLFFILFWVLVRPWRAVLPVLTMLIGIPFWRRTLTYSQPGSNSEKRPMLQVMSYNAMGFNKYDIVDTQRPDDANKMIEWVLKEPSDVKCFQEFYNDNSSVVFKTIRRLEKAGYPYYAVLHPPEREGPGKFFGVAVFSRYPIVKRGDEVFDNFNGLVWADVKVGADTVRVISVHMQSMGIRVGGMLDQTETNRVKSNTRTVLRQLRQGLTLRRNQIVRVEEFYRNSPHPIIICGDFNDTPYSYTYGKLRRLLRNAFEDAGRGFGFSYNKAPGFLRIDNQFYNARFLEPLNYVTYRDVKFSDHYPIMAQYAIKPREISKDRTPRTHVEFDF